MKRILAAVSALVFAASLSIAAESPKAGKSVTNTQQFKYPIEGKKLNLGMSKDTVLQTFKELTVEISSDPSDKGFTILSDINKKFYFKGDKLAIVKISYRNESILDIPEKTLGKGKVIKEEPNRITQWKKSNVTIIRTDFALDGGEDSESEIVIK